MARPGEVRRITRRVLGQPVAVGRVPARLPLVLEKHSGLFGSFSVPPLPAPVLGVHTGGKPMAYRSPRDPRTGRSLPGLVSFIPRGARAEAAFSGVGEGTLVHFDEMCSLPAWLTSGRHVTLVTFTNEVIVSITRRLLHELETGKPSKAYLRALGNALLAELQRELARPGSAESLAASRSGIRVASTAVDHMLANLGRPLPVAELAQACGMGVTGFSRSFRLATGATPHRYLRRMRIERASELLRTTGLSVGEISAAVGFRGQGHFCTAFVAERGITPLRYRREARTRRPS
jgi:AraC-like DNA-binding protein